MVKVKPRRKVSYSEKDISVLEGLEAVREKPGMYVGTTDSRGLVQVFKEPFDNGLDEAKAGNGRVIRVDIDTKNNLFTVADQGRGIPVGIHSKTKISTLTTVLTVLHAGGKLSRNQTGYNSSIGCLVGSTKIKLLNGKSVSIERLYDKWNKKPVPFWVYSYEIGGKFSFVPRKCVNVQISKYTKHLCDVELDNGEVVRVTPDHPFLLFKGKYRQAQKLKAGMRLRALYTRKDAEGYETHSGPARPKIDVKSHMHRTNRTVASALGWDIKEKHVHHKNGIKSDNRPSNLVSLDRETHFWEDAPNKHSKFLNWTKERRNSQSRRAKILNKNKSNGFEAQRGKIFNCALRAYSSYGKLTPNTYNKCRGWCYPSAATVPFYTDWKSLKTETKEFYEKNKGYSLFKRKIEYKLQSEYSNSPVDNAANHYVKSVKLVNLKKAVPVYDLSVEDTHNYLLDCGVFVHNTFGVGVSVTNALSKKLEVWTKRDGSWYYQAFSKGKPTTKVLKKRPPFAHPKGTIIRYTPDMTIFRGKVKAVEILRHIKNVSYFYPIKFLVNIDGKKYSYYHRNGAVDYVKSKCEKLGVEKIGKPVIYQGEGISFIAQWTDHSEEVFETYVNGSITRDGGTHFNALKQVITESFKPFITKKKSFRGDDLRIGLIGFLTVDVKSPEFHSQTKERLVSPEVAEPIKKALLPVFRNFIRTQKSAVKTIVNRAAELREIQQQFTLSKKNAAKLKTVRRGRILLPEKLATSATSVAAKRELFLVEGDSAGGKAKTARNRDYQEILALRGKILNVYRATDSKIGESKEIIDILQSIGYDPQLKDPYSRLRVGKIIFCTDADEDGRHIALLLSGLMQKVLGPLIEQGRVYSVVSPLFTSQVGSKKIYAESLTELRKQSKNPDKLVVTRLKGWGEASNEMLRNLAFDPKTRELLKLKSVNARDLKQFKDVMSAESDLRKVILGLSS